MVAAAQVSEKDTVVEIGPGRGALTRHLAGVAGCLVLVEIDQELVDVLAERFAGSPQVRIIHGDARELDIGAIPEIAGRDYKALGNLPYYAASPIIRRLLESAHPPLEIVVMVQREVAREMAAKPGKMSLLSVATQLYATPGIVCHVPPRAFNPPPKVHSSVIRLLRRDGLAVDLDSTERFFTLVRAGFAAPRKTIANSLAVGLRETAGAFAPALEDAGVDPGRRPATLSLEQWGYLYRAWRVHGPERSGDQER